MKEEMVDVFKEEKFELLTLINGDEIEKEWRGIMVWR